MQLGPSRSVAAAAAAPPGSTMALVSRCSTAGMGSLRHMVGSHRLCQGDSLLCSSLTQAAARSLAAAAAACSTTTNTSSRTSIRRSSSTSRSATPSSSKASSTSSTSNVGGIMQSKRVSLGAQAAAAHGIGAGDPGGSRGKTLMVVESPTKAAKIQKFLGDDYKVVASYGHVRDLANRPGSVKPEAGFEMVWQLTAGGAAKMEELAAASAGCRALLLATDPDREGEAISWHITEELKRRGVLPRPGLTLQRVTFNEVTQKAVTDALQQPRQVSAALVDAYLARRALDYLVGFNLSPLLWRRLGRMARSAGRVQSMALRLVCDREDERQLFRPEEYWSIAADFTASPSSSSSESTAAHASGGGVGVSLTARLVQVDGRRLQPMSVGSQQAAEALVARLWQQQTQQQQRSTNAAAAAAAGKAAGGEAVLYRVVSVVRKSVQRSPPPPLVTSTLQQEAGRRLGWGASKTMTVAQQLYEGANTGEGLITYMRTDGVNLSAEAVETLRSLIHAKFGDAFLPPPGARVYKSRAKNAQEAHEAIRPTNPALLPGQVQGLTPDQAKLYAIVWARAVASQMESAELEQVTVELQSPCSTLLLRSTGSSLAFPGYLAAWEGIGGSSSSSNAAAAAAGDGGAEDAAAETTATGLSDGEEQDDDAAALAGAKGGVLSRVLQQLHEEQLVELLKVLPAQHFTKPPARFTEASMVKMLEEAGVGRPSTYAPIIRLLQERGYVQKSGHSLAPTPLGRLMVCFLTLFFPRYVDVNFTAQVEEQLDEVSAGSLPWQQLLSGFHQPLLQDIAAAETCSTTRVFEQLEQRLEHLIFPQQQQQQQQAAEVSARAAAAVALDPRVCPVCGGRLVLKPSRLAGGFIGCSNHDSLGCTFGRPLWPDAEEAALLSDEEEQVAAAADGSDSSGTVVGSSKLLGQHPGTKQPVWIKRGPFGLYLQLGDHGPNPTAAAAGSSANGSSSSSSSSGKHKPKASSSAGPTRAALPRGVSWSDITLEAALQQLALPRTVGLHPESGEPILANSGRFGPYLKHRSLTVTLPQGCGPLGVTLQQALQAVAAKEERMRVKGRDPYEVKPSATKRSKKAASSSKGKHSKAAGTGSSSSNGRVKSITGYNLFAREMRGEVAANAAAKAAAAEPGGGSISKGSTLVQIAAAWKTLSEDERAAFNERAKQINTAESAAADAAAGDARSSSSSGTSSTRASSRGRTGTNGRRAYSTSSSNTGSSTGSSGSSRRRTSSTKALTGYQYYCQQQRAAVVASNPQAKPSGVLSLLAAAWRGLDEQQQQLWSQQAACRAAVGSRRATDERTAALV